MTVSENYSTEKVQHKGFKGESSSVVLFWPRTKAQFNHKAPKFHSSQSLQVPARPVCEGRPRLCSRLFSNELAAGTLGSMTRATKSVETSLAAAGVHG